MVVSTGADFNYTDFSPDSTHAGLAFTHADLVCTHPDLAFTHFYLN